jgi:transcriptional regulator with XRE-family HTH domain
MAKKRLRFTDEIRQAVNASGLTRYRICQELSIKEAQMSRFMNGKGFLGQANLDALAELLGLHVSAEKPRRKK